MGQRSKIYTRTGDNGSTGLATGGRLRKDDPRIAAIGHIDELNCSIGVIRAHQLQTQPDTLLNRIQHLLFETGAELANPGASRISADDISFLEHSIDDLNADLPALTKFILPGGCPAAASCHLSRAVCRRAERRITELYATAPGNHVLIFINRLSDLLFVLARHLNKTHGHPDTIWEPEHGKA